VNVFYTFFKVFIPLLIRQSGSSDYFRKNFTMCV